MNNFFKATTLAIAATLAAGTASANSFWVKDGVHLNAHSGPGPHYYEVATFNPCTRLDVIDYRRGWAKIAHNQQETWVSVRYLQDRSCVYYPPKKTSGKTAYKRPTYRNDY